MTSPDGDRNGLRVDEVPGATVGDGDGGVVGTAALGFGRRPGEVATGCDRHTQGDGVVVQGEGERVGRKILIAGRGGEGELRLLIDRLIADRVEHRCHIDFTDGDRNGLGVDEGAVVGNGDGGAIVATALGFGGRPRELAAGCDRHAQGDGVVVQREGERVGRKILIAGRGGESELCLFID